VGIGDDAAVIDPADGQLVACTDQIIDGVDFDSTRIPSNLGARRKKDPSNLGARRTEDPSSDHAECSLADVGFKSMAINLSDIAAMGATPTAALVTLALPRQDATRIAADVYEGILQAAAEFDVSIAGGDLSTYDGPLSINVALLGHVPAGAAWLRSGAQEGDAILVSGALGGSILGRHLRPEPRVQLAGRLRRHVHVTAAIDISDGLSLDLDRLCAASGVGAELETEQIPIHSDAIRLAQSSQRTPLEHAWSDGEDFELILTMSPADAKAALAADYGVPLTQIGRTVGRTGLWGRTGGKLKRLLPQGYLHRAAPRQEKADS
jgi:thiamine-monophosphate kinase